MEKNKSISHTVIKNTINDHFYRINLYVKSLKALYNLAITNKDIEKKIFENKLREELGREDFKKVMANLSYIAEEHK